MAIYLGLNVASAQGNFLVAQMAQTLNKSSENIEDHWAVIERAFVSDEVICHFPTERYNIVTWEEKHSVRRDKMNSTMALVGEAAPTANDNDFATVYREKPFRLL